MLRLFDFPAAGIVSTLDGLVFCHRSYRILRRLVLSLPPARNDAWHEKL
jgi:hypothetical protein